MISERIEHTYNCTADTFWTKIFFNEEYNRRLFLERLEFEAFDIVKFEETDDKIIRVADAKPKMVDLPGPLKKVAEKGVGYRENGSFDKKQQVFSVKIEPESLKGKLTINAEMRTEAAGEGKCRRIFDVTIDAKVFGVGGMIEKRILHDMKESYDKGAAFTNEYIAEKGLS